MGAGVKAAEHAQHDAKDLCRVHRPYGDPLFTENPRTVILGNLHPYARIAYSRSGRTPSYALVYSYVCLHKQVRTVLRVGGVFVHEWPGVAGRMRAGSRKFRKALFSEVRGYD